MTIDIKNCPVVIVGMGHVGQPMAAHYLRIGYRVVGFDTNPAVVEQLNQYKPTIEEPYVAEYFSDYRHNFSVVDQLPHDLGPSVFIVTVGTPVHNGAPIFDAIFAVANQLAPYASNSLFILRSTVLPGTTREFASHLSRLAQLNLSNVMVSYSPERMVEGNALVDMMEAPSIVGGVNEASLELASRFLLPVSNRVIKVDLVEAELAKLVSNAYRHNQITFANSVAAICELHGANAHAVRNAVNYGYSRGGVFRPGLGPGGPCLPKDMQMLLISSRPNANYWRELQRQADTPRQIILQWISAFIKRYYGTSQEPVKISLLGAAFKGKPITADVRGSESLLLVEELLQSTLYGLSPLSDISFDIRVADYQAAKIHDNHFEVTSNVPSVIANASVIIIGNDDPRYVDDVLAYVSWHVDEPAQPRLIVDPWGAVPEGVTQYDSNLFLYRYGVGVIGGPYSTPSSNQFFPKQEGSIFS